MLQSIQQFGIALAVSLLAVAVLASTIMRPRRALLPRRILAGLLVTLAILLYAYMPGLPANRPAPVASAGHVYVVYPIGQSPNPGIQQGSAVSALSARTGTAVWRRTLPDSRIESLTLFQDTLLVQTFTNALRGGHISALRGSDGALLWQYALSEYVSSSFMLKSGVLFVPGQTYITALRGVDGRQLWRSSGADAGTPGPLSIANGALYYMSSDSVIVAVDATNGKQLWQTPVEQVGASGNSLVAGSDAVYTRTPGPGADNADIEALRAADGSTLWSAASGTSDPIPFACASGLVYIQLDFGVAGLDAGSGRQLWRFGTGSDPASPDALDVQSVDLLGDTLYVTAQRSAPIAKGGNQLANPETLYALDAVTGLLKWKYAAVSDSPQLEVSGGVLFVNANDALSALNPATGRLLWRSKVYNDGPPTPWTDPDVAPIVFLASNQIVCQAFACANKLQNYLSAVNELDGERYWTVPIGPPQKIFQHWIS
jgi:outer membrane protein assembly factor BamB